MDLTSQNEIGVPVSITTFVAAGSASPQIASASAIASSPVVTVELKPLL